MVLFLSLGPTKHTLVVLLWFLDVHTTHRQLEGMVNCLFRFFSYSITGTQTNHYDVCSAIVAHMSVIESYIRSHDFESTWQYLQATRMNKPVVWVWCIYYTPIIVYVAHVNGWVK